MVVRQRGRGTMISDRSLQTANLTQTYSFTEQMKAIGRVPKTTILEFTEVEADKNIAAEMNARLGERLYKIKRLRIADGVPLMIECTYLPSRKFFALKRPLIENKSLYDMIEQDYHEKFAWPRKNSTRVSHAIPTLVYSRLPKAHRSWI